MKNEIILWFCCIVLVFILGYIKNITDTDYPITGTFGIEGRKVSYRLDKVSHDKNVYKNIIISDTNEIEGKLIWNYNGKQKETLYKKVERGLECDIPRLNPGQMISYKVILIHKDYIFEIPKDGFTTLTFWGHIPSGVNALNFFFLYGGLLMSLRSTFELFNKNRNLKKYSVIVCVLLLTLVTIIFPLYNTYKLGAINSYIPSLTELIEPELLVLLLLWIAGTILIFNKKYIRTTAISISAVTVLLFFIL